MELASFILTIFSGAVIAILLRGIIGVIAREFFNS